MTSLSFRTNAATASERLVREAEGFGGDSTKRKKKKKEFLSKREKKIKKLKNRPSHWQGLENVSYGDNLDRDPRTPGSYFVKRRKSNSMRIVEQLIEGNMNGASSLIKKEIERKISKKSKVQKGRMDGAKQIEMHIFGD